jgi:3-mercaptopyruvate sulfurtransferase SseA
MKKARFIKATWTMFFILLLPSAVSAMDLPAIVSMDWPAENLAAPKIIILDFRKVEYYRDSHIPDTINDVYRAWSFKKAAFHAEVPENEK